MNSTFNYHLPFNKKVLVLMITFAVLAIIGLLIPFSVNTRRYNFNNHMLFIGGMIFTVLFGIVALILYLKSSNSIKNSQAISLELSQFIFPVGASGKIEIPYTEIGSVSEIGNQLNGNILQVKARNSEFKTVFIQGKGFDSLDQYRLFINQLKEKTNL